MAETSEPPPPSIDEPATLPTSEAMPIAPAPEETTLVEYSGSTNSDEIPSPSRASILGMSLLVEGSMAVTAIALAYIPWVEVDLWSKFHFNWEAIGWGLLGAAAMVLLLWIIDKFPHGPFRQVKDLGDYIRPILRNCEPIDYWLLATLAGFCEEILFRGWGQGLLSQYVSPWTANLLLAIPFGLCHAISMTYIVVAGIISVFLGGLLIWTDNLLVPMITHGVYDLIALYMVMGRKKS